MITIISGTNRPGNISRIIARDYLGLFSERGEEVGFVDLEQLPPDFAFSDVYGNRTKEFAAIQALLDRTEKIIFVVPEYNGSIPGILKLFIDALDYPNTWIGKKAAIVGISAGAGGNAKGIAHLTDILNYLGVPVLPGKLEFPMIREKVTPDGFSRSADLSLLARQMDQLLEF